jgi:hypothetical protein
MSSDDTTTDKINPASILGGMAARREEIIASAHTDLRVPRWTDPEVFVRFAPVDHGVIRRGQVRVDKAPDKDKARVEVEANSDLLAAACVGVFAVIDGKEYSLRPGDYDGAWTGFDDDLAEALGMDPSARTARQVIKALYMFEPDIIKTAGDVVEFSGYVTNKSNERVTGE